MCRHCWIFLSGSVASGGSPASRTIGLRLSAHARIVPFQGDSLSFLGRHRAREADDTQARDAALGGPACPDHTRALGDQAPGFRLDAEIAYRSGGEPTGHCQSKSEHADILGDRSQANGSHDLDLDIRRPARRLPPFSPRFSITAPPNERLAPWRRGRGRIAIRSIRSQFTPVLRVPCPKRVSSNSTPSPSRTVKDG